MEIREDILFNYWVENKFNSISIINNAPQNTILIFHPHEVSQNNEKIKQFCPKFYGEMEKEKIFIMEKENGCFYLNHELELVQPENSIITHFNGKLMVEKCYNNSYTIKNNQNQILFKNVKAATDAINSNVYEVYQKYLGAKEELKIVISKKGFLHLAHNSNITFVNKYFYEYYASDNLYIIYDINCQPLATADNLEKTKTILKCMLEDNNNNALDNPLEEKRQALYEQFLYLRWYKKFGIKKNENENYVKTITEELSRRNLAYAYDLKSEQFIGGTFKNCLKLESKNSDIQVNDLQELESAIEEYKRTRELVH